MSKRIFVNLLAVIFLGIPSIAKANFFDDGRWYMDSSQWNVFDADPLNRTSLVDQNNRLEWITAPGWTDTYEPIMGYGSKWAFDLKDDFEFSVGFNYEYIATHYPHDYGTVLTGLFYGNPNPQQTNSYTFATGASSDVDYNNNSKKQYWADIVVPGSMPVESNWSRMNDSGTLNAHYDSLNDELQFSAEGGVATYAGLKSNLGLTQLNVFFAAGTDGAPLVSGDAYLNNFKLVKGTITPEPVSCALFLLGGGAMLIGRRLKKKTKESIS